MLVLACFLPFIETVNSLEWLNFSKIHQQSAGACILWIAKKNLYLTFKEAPMAKHNSKAVAKSVNVAETAKESAMLRTLRIDGSQNGATLRTRVVRDKTKYNRNVKHRKSFADAGDFPFYAVFNPLPNRIVVRSFYF